MVNYDPKTHSGWVSITATCEFGLLLVYCGYLLYQTGANEARSKTRVAIPNRFPATKPVEVKSGESWSTVLVLFLCLCASGFIFIVNGFFVNTNKIQEPFEPELHH